jgi:hypothetical protein
MAARVSSFLAFLACAWIQGASPGGAQQTAPPATLPEQAARPDPANQAAVDAQLNQRWRAVRGQLNEWLSVQKIYPPQQAQAMVQHLDRSVTSMSRSEVEELIASLEGKLRVLMSPEAASARNYLSYFNEQARQRMLQQSGGVPDLARMTSSQISQELMKFQQERQTTRQAFSTFEQQQQQRVAAAQSERAAQQQASQRALDRATFSARQSPSSPAYTSPFSSFRHQVPQQQRSFYVSPWGGVGYTLQAQ